MLWFLRNLLLLQNKDWIYALSDLVQIWQYSSWPTPVAARSKAWVCSSLLVGIAGSNPAEGMDVCLVRVLCVVR